MSKLLIVPVLALALWLAPSPPHDHNDPKPQPPAPTPTPTPLKEAEKLSYAFGLDVGQNIKRMPAKLDLEVFVAALKDVVEDRPLRLTPPEAAKVKEEFFRSQQDAKEGQAQANLTAAEAFLAENKSKEGVQTTASGLQYLVLKAGSGDAPTTNSKVRVHYAGTLLDGQEFDNSYKRGTPAEFPVTGVIAGWTEALQLMQPGARFKLFIHPKLAYGAQGRPGIPANALLIFEVELLEVVK